MEQILVQTYSTKFAHNLISNVDIERRKETNNKNKQTKTLLAPYDHISHFAVPTKTSQKQILIDVFT